MSGAEDAPDASAVLDFSELNASIDRFTRRFEQYVHDTVAASDAERLAADTHRVEAQEQHKALERERESTKHAQKQLWESRCRPLTHSRGFRARGRCQTA